MGNFAQNQKLHIMESILSLDKFYLFLGIFLAVCILVIVAIMLDLGMEYTRQRKPISGYTPTN